MAYVGASAEERAAGDRQQGKELREYCASEVATNDNYFSPDLPNFIILEKTNEEYATWIKVTAEHNTFTFWILCMDHNVISLAGPISLGWRTRDSDTS